MTLRRTVATACLASGVSAHLYTATLSNSGAITGGVGGAGGVGGGGVGNYAVKGGSGGAGANGNTGVYSFDGYLTNLAVGGVIVGGAGGAGGAGGPGYTNLIGRGGSGGSGGAGGYGVSLYFGSTVNHGSIAGGAGGVGGKGGYGRSAVVSGHLAYAGYGGGGAHGGAGVLLNGAVLTNTAQIVGGAGGHGGAAGHSYGGEIIGGLAGAGGHGSAAVRLTNGGSLINSGTIIGGAGGAGLSGTASIGDGVDVQTGQINNQAGGTISGLDGVVDSYAGQLTLTNAGLVAGVKDAVIFAHSSDCLIVESGGTFIGAIVGGGGTLELATGSETITGLGATGTISGAASGTFSGFGSYLIDGGDTVDLGGNTLLAGAMLTNDGNVVVNSGSNLTIVGSLLNSEIISVGGGGEAFAGLLFSGAETLSDGGAVSLAAAGYIGGVGASLTNLDNTIEGGGSIKSVALTNKGTINNDVGRMMLNTGGVVTNDGIIESTGTGILLVRNTTIDSSGGGFVTDSKRLQLSNGTISGGFLTINIGALLINDGLGGTVNLGGGTVHNSGTIEAAAGGLTIDGAVLNNGLIEAISGNLTITGAVTGTGTARLWGKGNLEIDGALSENVFFAKNSTGTLVLGDITTTTNSFTGRIYGLSTTSANHIDLSNLAFAAGDTATFTGSAVGGTLTIYDSANVAKASLKLSGHYPHSSTFTVARRRGQRYADHRSAQDHGPAFPGYGGVPDLVAGRQPRRRRPPASFHPVCSPRLTVEAAATRRRTGACLTGAPARVTPLK